MELRSRKAVFVNEVRQHVLPYLLLSFHVLRSLAVETQGWRLCLNGLVEMLDLGVLESELKQTKQAQHKQQHLLLTSASMYN